MVSEAELRQTICDVGRRLWDRNLIGACEGNITARLGQDLLLSTPTGSNKGFMKPSDIVVIDLDGNPLEGGQSSSEIGAHLCAYKHRSDCMAIVHAHPLTTIAMSVARADLPDDILPESAYVLGPVAFLKFAYPGTSAVAEGMLPYIKDRKTFVLSHHGALTLGKDLWDACDRMETLERVAEIITKAKLLGRIQPLNTIDFEKLSEVALHGRLD